MDLGERLLYHQIHPLKLLADGGAELVSLPLFWRHRLWTALAVHFLPAVLASLVLVRWGDLEPYRRSALGRYVSHQMTPRRQALRALGDLVMVLGAWRHRPLVILLGGLTVLFGWLGGYRLSIPRSIRQ